MALMVYDTRSREKRELRTIEDGRVRMYVCGITPYTPSHLGHARCYLAFDVVHRWLEASGYDVDYVQNFTDIDDKILAISDAEGVDYSEVANRNIADFYEVMDAMNVLRADSYPRVTETIPEIIDMVSTLIDKGHAYIGDDGVYFEIDTAPEKFGQLTGQTLEMVRAGAGGRVEDTGSGKRDHRDFALWKLAKPGEPRGTALGGQADRVGTSSALRCRSSTSASSSTSTAAATTSDSPTTKPRSSSPSVVQAASL
jgi:cysteinyl-tRNA synthetase